MSATHELERLEKEAFRKFYEDGLFDVFLGAMIMLMPLTEVVESWFESTGVILAVLATVYFGIAFALKAVRTNLLRSRLGTMTPSPARARKIGRVRLALALSVLLGIVVFALTGYLVSQQAEAVMYVPALWFLNASVVLGVMGYYLDVPRFMVYGPLIGLVMPLALYPRQIWDVEIPLWVSFGVPGAVVVVVGIYKLARFLRDYPVRDAGVALDA